MYLTYLDSNSWLIEIGEKTILLDPWLFDNLTFGNADWFFKGTKLKQREIPEHIDLILLSQGLEDHAHIPTLKKLDRNIPVLASVNAAKVVKDLNYTNVTAVDHGEEFTLDDKVNIKAFPGSLVGFNLIENGYVLTELETGFSLYYEPHGNHPDSLKEIAPVDVAIAPLINLGLPLVGAFIKGGDSALELAKMLQPQVMLSTAAGGDVEFEGLLTKLLTAEGTIEDFQELLKKHNLDTQVIDPKAGDRLEVKLQKRELVA
ncbi:MAG: MBL fold metallo-hydrolase [Cyanobacteria bacterium P01_A01_bin.45]